MTRTSRTHYAHSGDYDIAYQVLGERSAPTLLWMNAGTLPIGAMDDEPTLARVMARLSSLGRLVRYDRRGIGLSDRGSPEDVPTPNDWDRDTLAVLDDLEVTDAVIIADSLATPIALRFAARHPERASALVLINPSARMTKDGDYHLGFDPPSIDEVISTGTRTDAVEQGVDLLEMMLPSVAHDAAFRDWFDRAGNLGTTPKMANALISALYQLDARGDLGAIRCRTLAVVKRDVKPASVYGPPAARYVVDAIEGAQLVEVPGRDVFSYVGDPDAWLVEVEEFLTGSRGLASDRELTTIMFTDIVDSTALAASLGDTRFRDLLEAHDKVTRTHIARWRGREITTTGDGFVAIFPSPSTALQCAAALAPALAPHGVRVRVGIHTGEVERRGDDVAGLAVHVAARVAAVANAGEIVTSSVVPLLVTGTPWEFTSLGTHDLKGVEQPWELFRVL